MSDLQCPAKVVLAVHDRPPSLAGQRFSGVFLAPDVAADAEALAAASGFAEQANCAFDTLGDARDAASLVRTLQELSDVYRGETIVVLTSEAMLRDAIGRAADSAQPIVLSIDSSGWTVVGPLPSVG